MPQVPGSKSGYDYSALLQVLNSTGLQQSSAPTYQVVKQLVDGARTFQGFIEQQYPQLDGSSNSLFYFVTSVIKELNEVRNNSKFSVSLANERSQLLPANVETPVTFDIAIFNDGWMADPSLPIVTDIVLNANGQYMITIQCTFASETVT